MDSIVGEVVRKGCARGLSAVLLAGSLLSVPVVAQNLAVVPPAPSEAPAVSVSPGWPTPADIDSSDNSVVACARSLDGTMVAWLAPGTGLIVSGWLDDPGATLVMEGAAFPRFTADGRLLIDVGLDDGEMLLQSATWVLDPGSRTPRRPLTGEALPAWQPPQGSGGPAQGASSTQIKIAVDAGHGGSDSGALGNGLQEKDINLDVALRLAALLAADSADTHGGGDWNVLLTRSSDVFVSLQQRVTLANSFGAASFVSIHSNSFSSPAANGTETYAFAEGTTAAALRDKVHTQMLAAWGLTDRGTKTANFFVLVNTTMPASLSEMGFITNPGDAAFLGSPQSRQVMALGHLFAIQSHHGFAPYDPTTGPVGGTLKGILYDAAAGPGAPIAGGTVALSDGTFTTTSGSGLFTFPLPSGTYSFAGTAPGFTASQASETVTTGDVWESLGLSATAQPTLSMLVTGNNLDIDIGGDVGSLAGLLYSTTPGLPLLGVGAKGLLWPDAASLTVLPLNTIPAGGKLHLDVVLPSLPGVKLHCQALAGFQGLTLLSNGAAFAFP